MKTSKKRTLARLAIVIFWQAWIFLLPVGVIVLIWYLNIYKLPGWAILCLQIILSIGAFIIAGYQIRTGKDGELVKKWGEKQKEKINKAKSTFYESVAEVQKEYYLIECIIPHPSRAAIFQIKFFNQIIGLIMPIIYLNEKKLSLKLVDDFNVLCFAWGAIDSQVEKLVFKCGSSEKILSNPYFIQDIPPEGIVWQCEGHSDERKIHLDSRYFPYVTDTPYPFIMLIGGKSFGEYTGLYAPDKGALVVNISNLSKKQCEKKCCCLKPSFGGKKIFLPTSTVQSVNHELLNEISFHS